MSDMPEQINAWAVRVQPLGNDEQAGLWRSAMKPTNSTEYRRADLPPTDAECLRNEKVRALVEAVRRERNMLCQDMDMQIKASDAVEAALAALPEVKE